MEKIFNYSVKCLISKTVINHIHKYFKIFILKRNSEQRHYNTIKV
jgi:hypothetical protein